MKRTTSTKGKGPVQINTLVIAHHDGDLHYKLKRGGYCIQNDSISISVETEAIEREQFPDCALLALEGFPLKDSLTSGLVFEHKGGMLEDRDDALPKAHGYFTFHADKVAMRWTVESVEVDAVIFRLEATQDDVIYYDAARSKKTPTQGLFRLARKPRSRLWIPS